MANEQNLGPGVQNDFVLEKTKNIFFRKTNNLIKNALNSMKKIDMIIWSFPNVNAIQINNALQK